MGSTSYYLIRSIPLTQLRTNICLRVLSHMVTAIAPTRGPCLRAEDDAKIGKKLRAAIDTKRKLVLL